MTTLGDSFFDEVSSEIDMVKFTVGLYAERHGIDIAMVGDLSVTIDGAISEFVELLNARERAEILAAERQEKEDKEELKRLNTWYEGQLL
jgi:hypothetical protein